MHEIEALSSARSRTDGRTNDAQRWSFHPIAGGRRFTIRQRSSGRVPEAYITGDGQVVTRPESGSKLQL